MVRLGRTLVVDPCIIVLAKQVILPLAAPPLSDIAVDSELEVPTKRMDRCGVVERSTHEPSDLSADSEEQDESRVPGTIQGTLAFF